ncbi:hypothetical protein J3A78_006716 [Streptomyces sp. PvR006]|nr:hypothetical protein [Streptomyces sp. PvR006]
MWRLPAEGLGGLLGALPHPMTLGRVDLADGTSATGFFWEPQALEGTREITSYGSWRAALPSFARGDTSP